MTRSDSSTLVLRLVAGLAGGMAFVGLLPITLGLALAALIGMGVTAAVLRSRGRPFTRMASWLGAVGGVALTLAIGITIVLVLASDSLMAAMREGAQAEQTREPTAFERTLERMSPRTPASSAMERRMEDVTMSGPFMWASVMIGSAMMSALAGVLVGSAAWGCALLGLYGSTGRWPPGARDAQEAGIATPA
jgi:hypothetical protein